MSEMLTMQYSWVQTKLLVLFPDKMSMASMEKHLFNLKFAAKELERNSKKCDKVYNIINISSNPERLDWRVDEEYNDNNILSFCKK